MIPDESEVRQLVAWLEDMRIRHYKLDEREPLRDIKSKDWNSVFEKYLNDIQCPTELRSHTPVTIDWLLNYAIQLEHSDQFPSSSNDEGVKDENENAMKVVASTSGSASNTSNETSELHQSAPFNLYVSPSDLQDSRVKDSLAQLAQLLNFPPTTNQFALLKAISALIEERLSKHAIAVATAADQKSEVIDTLDLKNIPLGFKIDDPLLAESAKILRLLHIAELRNLQTSINELIVSIQSFTANPKTNSALGEVGR